MSRYDLIVRGGTVVTSAAASNADIGIVAGRIAAVQSGLIGDAKETIDATGLSIFPGLIDSHVHFNEPGRTEWEGIRTGSEALAAGGGTMFFDMPLNSHPPTLDAAAFDLKLAAAQANSLTDFGLWGGLVPGNVDRLPELAERGVVGFKAFMCDSGIEDFPCADEKALRAGMKRAAELGRIVAVHAENQEMVATRTNDAQRRGACSARDYLDSRPLQAELDAIRLALDIAGETGCSLHVVHVTNADAVGLIAHAATLGVDATCETCPHYLSLTDQDFVLLGAVAKCAPPLRSGSVQDGLWNSLAHGQVATIGSDHSPSPAAMKAGDDFFKIWGGISGVQHTLPLLLTEGRNRLMPVTPLTQIQAAARTPSPPMEERAGERRPITVARSASQRADSPASLPLPFIASLTSANVARRFRLPQTKGRIEPGADADLALVDLAHSFKVESGDLFYRHRQSPYIGRRLTGSVVRTILRGRTIFLDGKIVSKPAGRLVTPAA